MIYDFEQFIFCMPLSKHRKMTKEELKNRTKAFHIAVIKACEMLPRNAAGFELAKQVIRSAGSVGANYRAACRAKSTADFIYKIEIIIEEADESMYWLEVCSEAKLLNNELTGSLLKEANELTSIFVATVKTLKLKNPKKS
jgi:four helix bundle protein